MSTSKRSYFSQMRALRREDFQDLRPLTDATASDPAIEVSLLIPAREATHALEDTLSRTHEFLEKRFQNRFEIILVPNPPPGSPSDDSLLLSEQLTSRFKNVRVAPHLVPPERPGKGAALRTGFAAARGSRILFTDADLPYDLRFFDDAFRKLDQGFDLVTANRRVPDSRFDIPTALLPVAYGRHRLGLIFNRVVRLLLPLDTTDTQAGIKAMSRRLAEEAFKRQRCPGFFFDLELFLTCRGKGWAQAEVPITLYLNTEKSTVRVLRESVLAIYWLYRIWAGYLVGHYGKPSTEASLLRRYQGLNLGTRFFLFLRWKLTPYAQMEKHLPRKGLVYDLGCGHGLFALDLARNSPEREVVGLDHDRVRVAIAQKASQGIPNLRFETGDLSQASGRRSPGAISIIDVMHYFDFSTQESHLAETWRLLDKNGTLIFREVDPDGGWISKWNRVYEKIATSIGFTRSKEESLYFRTQEEWLEVLARAGFRARAERCSHFLFADVLYIGEKAPEASL